MVWKQAKKEHISLVTKKIKEIENRGFQSHKVISDTKSNRKCTWHKSTKYSEIEGIVVKARFKQIKEAVKETFVWRKLVTLKKIECKLAMIL